MKENEKLKNEILLMKEKFISRDEVISTIFNTCNNQNNDSKTSDVSDNFQSECKNFYRKTFTEKLFNNYSNESKSSNEYKNNFIKESYPLDMIPLNSKVTIVNNF